jgi:hypothetical protein
LLIDFIYFVFWVIGMGKYCNVGYWDGKDMVDAD